MRIKKFFPTALCLIAAGLSHSSGASAQNGPNVAPQNKPAAASVTNRSVAANGSTTVIRITGTRLAYPLFQKWADAYSSTHPGLKFVISKVPADSADLLIVSHQLGNDDIKTGQTALVVSSYVQLPVVNSHRNDVAALQARGFNDSSYRQVYFADQSVQAASLGQFTVYKRQQPACASISFANHFGSQQKDIKGVGVTGDDKDLLAAVKRDPNGISYNNLGFLYDLKTRKLLDSIAIVPTDLNGNGQIDPEENFYGSLDDVISFVERTHNPKILQENVNVLYRKNGPVQQIVPFLQWVLSNGQQFNHEYGFINPDPALIQSEEQSLSALSKK